MYLCDNLKIYCQVLTESENREWSVETSSFRDYKPNPFTSSSSSSSNIRGGSSSSLSAYYGGNTSEHANAYNSDYNQRLFFTEF